MKNILNFLRKIGLVHVSKGDYNSGEFDNRSDLNNKKAKKVSGGKSSTKVRTIMFWVAVLFALFFLLAALSISFGWFLFIAVMWGMFLFFFRKWAFLGMYTTKLGVILFAVLFVVTFFVIPTDSQTTSGTSTTACEAKSLSKKADERITAKIVVSKDVQKTVMKDVYSLNDFGNLAYGYNGQETEEGYYVHYELCKGDTTLSFTDLEAEEWNFKQDDSGALSASSGQYTDFVSEQSDGTISNDIEDVGTYTVYAYISYNGKKWFIADEYSFEVK